MPKPHDPRDPSVPFNIDDAISEELSIPEGEPVTHTARHPLPQALLGGTADVVTAGGSNDEAFPDLDYDTRVETAIPPDLQALIDARVSRHAADLQPLPRDVKAELVFADRRIAITKSLTIIGRVTEVADVAFPDDDRLSRHHAAVIYSDGGFSVEDLDSTNGTFVAGKRIKRAPLEHGVEVRLGRHAFRLKVT